MTLPRRRNQQDVSTPRGLAAFLMLILAAGGCNAPDAATSFDDAALFNNGGPERLVVCHYDTDAGTYEALTLPVMAVQPHLHHGDALPGDRLPDDSGAFGPACEEIPDPPAFPNIVEIHPPSATAGAYDAAGASFGPLPTTAGVVGSVVLVNDGTGIGTDACEPLVGFTAGAIALVDRGDCLFTVKAANVQAAGAVAMVVVNSVAGDPVTMGGSDATIVIPSVMVSLEDGTAIKAGLPAEGTVRRHP